MSQITTEVLLILFLILANGLFSLAEMALVSARKTRLLMRAEDGDARAINALALLDKPNRLFSTVQVFITTIGIFSGALGGQAAVDQLTILLVKIPWLADSAEGISIAIVVLTITFFSLVLGELIPKRIALQNPERLAMYLAGLMRFFSVVAAPVVHLLSFSTDLGLRLLRIKPIKEEPENEEEIKVLLQQGMQVGEFEAAEQDMVEGIFRMSDRTVDVIMTPRTELEWVDLDEPLEENLAMIAASSHTRFPVAQGSLDNIAGVLVSKDMLTAQLRGQPLDLSALLQPPLLVPESMPAFKVLELFKTSGAHIALVIDEYGGLLGMVTLFDILKSIVGALPQNAGDLQPQAFQREDGSWLMDGLMPVDEFKDLLELDDLPDEDRVGFQTLGGFVMNQLGEVPTAGQMFTWEQFKFEIVDMDGRRVDKILISMLPGELPENPLREGKQ